MSSSEHSLRTSRAFPLRCRNHTLAKLRSPALADCALRCSTCSVLQLIETDCGPFHALRSTEFTDITPTVSRATGDSAGPPLHEDTDSNIPGGYKRISGFEVDAVRFSHPLRKSSAAEHTFPGALSWLTYQPTCCRQIRGSSARRCPRNNVTPSNWSNCCTSTRQCLSFPVRYYPPTDGGARPHRCH